MRRLVHALVLLLVIVNIAHADLIRPCHCGPENPYSCGTCPQSKGETSERVHGDKPTPC